MLLDWSEINQRSSKFQKWMGTWQLFLQPGAFSRPSDAYSLPLLSQLVTELGPSLRGPWSPCPPANPPAGSYFALAHHIPAPAVGWGRRGPTADTEVQSP